MLFRSTCRSKFEQGIAEEICRKFGNNPRPNAVRVASTIIEIKVETHKVGVVTAKWRAAKRQWASDLESFTTTSPPPYNHKPNNAMNKQDIIRQLQLISEELSDRPHVDRLVCELMARLDAESKTPEAYLVLNRRELTIMALVLDADRPAGEMEMSNCVIVESETRDFGGKLQLSHPRFRRP